MIAAQPDPVPESSAVASLFGGAKGGPTALRILLGTQLRRLREGKQISREDAGEAIRASHAKISRMELGRVGFKSRDILDLLTLYGVDEPEKRAAYLDLAERANSPGWWQKYNDLMEDWFETFVGLEEAASVIRTYEVQFVPGLLQTRDYARAVIMLGHPGATDEDIERRVDLRMTRQDLLSRSNAPKIWAVIDEGALRRPFGGPEVMRAQLEHLIQLTDSGQSNVQLQVMPFQYGGHAAAGGPFTILRFSERDLPDVVYLEQLTSAIYLDKRDEVDHYMMVMDRLCIEAEARKKTTKLLQSYVKEL
ncbi:MAG: helix-turn-helix domain-containing protein [Streptosporangiales bacterium]|nr:helix-turn-helix domain-containing protein [Streptosporangiales bacterium]